MIDQSEDIRVAQQPRTLKLTDKYGVKVKVSASLDLTACINQFTHKPADWGLVSDCLTKPMVIVRSGKKHGGPIFNYYSMPTYQANPRSCLELTVEYRRSNRYVWACLTRCRFRDPADKSAGAHWVLQSRLSPSRSEVQFTDDEYQDLLDQIAETSLPGSAGNLYAQTPDAPSNRSKFPDNGQPEPGSQAVEPNISVPAEVVTRYEREYSQEGHTAEEISAKVGRSSTKDRYYDSVVARNICLPGEVWDESLAACPELAAITGLASEIGTLLASKDGVKKYSSCWTYNVSTTPDVQTIRNMFDGVFMQRQWATCLFTRIIGDKELNLVVTKDWRNFPHIYAIMLLPNKPMWQQLHDRRSLGIWWKKEAWREHVTKHREMARIYAYLPEFVETPMTIMKERLDVSKYNSPTLVGVYHLRATKKLFADIFHPHTMNDLSVRLIVAYKSDPVDGGIYGQAYTLYLENPRRSAKDETIRDSEWHLEPTC